MPMLSFEELPKLNSERWLSLENLPYEEWRDVKGYEELLSISNYGRLKKKYHSLVLPKGGIREFKEEICRLYKLRGYCKKSVVVNYKTHNLAIHRLVAIAFIDNKDNLPFINHKDENPSNNCVDNLEWCTPRYNTCYGSARKRATDTYKKNGFNKAVVLYDYEGNKIKEYETIVEASKEYSNCASICMCCQGKIPTADGYHFRYKGENYTKREIKKEHYNCVVTFKDGTRIKYKSIRECCSSLKVPSTTLMGIIKGRKLKNALLEDKEIDIVNSKGEMCKIVNGKKL